MSGQHTSNMVSRSHTSAIETLGWRMILCMLAAAAALFLSGCLSRPGSGPSLPYVKPANSVAQENPAPLQIASRMQEMEAELHRLWDTIERLKAAGGDEQEMANLRARIAFIEQQLGIDPAQEDAEQRPGIKPQATQTTPEQAAGAGSPQRVGEAPPASPEGRSVPKAPDIRNTPVATDEQQFRAAYAAFRNRDADRAIQLFEALLQNYPKSALASSAVYWIGEAHFAKGQFDEAVLYFDRVIKEFPGSKKELSALLRQGQAFEKMGDPQSARIIFSKLVKDHPHTAQARVAAARLKTLPPPSGDQNT